MKYIIGVIFGFVFSFQSYAADGRVFLQTDPVGASVKLLSGEDVINLIGKTPAIFNLPVGKSKICISLAKHIDSIVEINVNKSGIGKPKLFKLVKSNISVDILYEQIGWQVFVDGDPVNDVNGTLALTPCTIDVTLDTKIISIAKIGFRDNKLMIAKHIEDKPASFRFTNKPVRGMSKLLKVKKTVKTKTAKKKIDFENITIEQWNKLKGITFTVQAHKKLDTKITLSNKQKIAIVPNPKDRWYSGGNAGPLSYKGHFSREKNGFHHMALCYKLGEKVGKYGVIKGYGKLFLFGNDHIFYDNKGSIKVKLVKID